MLPSERVAHRSNGKTSQRARHEQPWLKYLIHNCEGRCAVAAAEGLQLVGQRQCREIIALPALQRRAWPAHGVCRMLATPDEEINAHS